jgi:hypothetical protein
MGDRLVCSGSGSRQWTRSSVVWNGGSLDARFCFCKPYCPFFDRVEIHREATSGDDARAERFDDLKLACASFDQVISLPGERLPHPNFPDFSKGVHRLLLCGFSSIFTDW